MVRLDSKGRRIGRNWWREYNMELFTLERIVWEQRREAVAGDYATEMREFEEENPQPNLKHFLVNNKGINS